jgi:hypothetical protein
MIFDRLKTGILLALLSGLLLLMGQFIGGQTGLHIALFIALLSRKKLYCICIKPNHWTNTSTVGYMR